MVTASKVLIISGGLTHERDVSLRSGRRVANILTHGGPHEVQVCEFDSGLLPRIKTFQPDVVWPIVHGSMGEDGSLQTLLETLDIPFIGSESRQSMLATSKPTAKGLLAAAGLNTPSALSLPEALFRQVGVEALLRHLEAIITFPVVIKPTVGGSGLGASRANDLKEMRTAMVDAYAYGDTLMVENFVSGTEVAAAILDVGDNPVALPLVEIETDDGKYDYDARYTTDTTEYFVPARLSDEVTLAVQEAALAAHRILGLRHLSRMDFIVDKNGTPWFIDANVIPGMTDTSLFPQAADSFDSFESVCEALIDDALGE